MPTRIGMTAPNGDVPATLGSFSLSPFWRVFFESSLYCITDSYWTSSTNQSLAPAFLQEANSKFRALYRAESLPEMVQGQCQRILISSLDYGRPKKRTLILSTDGLKVLRGQILIDNITLEEDVILVQLGDAATGLDITIFWKKAYGSCCNLRIKTIKIFFPDQETWLAWTTCLANSSRFCKVSLLF
jgi:hypothetical protein